MKKFYNSLYENQRIIFWIVVTDCAAFFISFFCFFIGRYDIPLGILFGGGISIFNFWLLTKQVEQYVATSHPKRRALFYYLLRYLLYGAGLAIALVLERWVIPVFQVFAVFGAYLVQKLVIMIYGWKERSEKK